MITLRYIFILFILFTVSSNAQFDSLIFQKHLSPYQYGVQALGDQNGDGVNDFLVIACPYYSTWTGYSVIYLGNPYIVVNVKPEKSENSINMLIYENYPNPFNSSTKIKFNLNRSGKVTIELFNILGERVALLMDEHKAAGTYQVDFNAAKYNLSSGVYFCQMKNSNGTYKIIKLNYLK